MKLQQSTIPITFSIGSYTLRVSNMVLERLQRSIPKHSHSRNSYEIHYIASGYGQAVIDGKKYKIIPNTLYVTGPFVEHEQIPTREDPMCEYCIYLKLEKQGAPVPRREPDDPDDIALAQAFAAAGFWFGQDTQDIHASLKLLFAELEHQYTGCMVEMRALLQQIIVRLVRNYEYKKKAGPHCLPSNLDVNPYLVIEECFLYEYQTITLEQLAARLGLGVRQTQRLLKDHYSRTFLQKKTESRMSAASIQLADHTRSITQISQDLGYSSVEHFSAAFRRYYGISASAFRKRKGLEPEE